MAQRPIALALHVCEGVAYEEGTGDITLFNWFRRRVVKKVPTDPPFPFWVFARLTDGQGEMKTELVIERLRDREVVYRRPLSFSLASPLQEAKVRIRIADCIFPDAGDYGIDLLVDGESVASSRLTIRLEENP
jgi:hypothetical protein